MLLKYSYANTLYHQFTFIYKTVFKLYT